MSRPKGKESKAQTFRLCTDITARLETYHRVSRVPKTAIVELALDEYLSKREQKGDT